MEKTVVTCLFCKQFYFSAGSPWYSEYTPGYEATWGCQQNVWEIDDMMDNTEDVRKKMLTAGQYKKFEPISGVE